MLSVSNRSFDKGKRLRARRGATLLDVATGSMILAILLVPAVHLISESRSAHHRLVQREIALFEANRLLEAAKVSLSDATAFDAALRRPVDSRMTIPVSDGPDLQGRLTIEKDMTLATADLLTLNVDVWRDVNANGRHDADETGEKLRTQWAAP